MDLSQITTLFGRSIYDPVIDTVLAEYDARCEDREAFCRERYASLNSSTCGLTFTFWYKGFYQESIAPPTSTFKADKEAEVVLSEMTFCPDGLRGIPLPFNLCFGDNAQAIQQALGKKPFSKSKNVAGENFWTFYENDFELAVVFDNNGLLARFRIWALHKPERKKRDLVENLQQQKANISPDHCEMIEKHKEAMPTHKWEQRMRSGDSGFTPEFLTASEQIFSAFVDSVVKATRKRNATAIYSAVKNAVVGFNKLCKKQSGVIETVEREEIVEYLQATVKLSGFLIEDGVDLTQDYRIW